MNLRLEAARLLTVCALALAAATAPAWAQATLTGTVVDTVSNTRVVAAQVLLLQVGSSQTAITDSAGRFRFDVAPGMARLRITALGYSALESGILTLEKDDRVSLLAIVTSAPVPMLPLYVIAKTRRPPTGLESFYQRKKQNAFGHFMDEQVLARINAYEVSDYMRRVPGAVLGRDNVQLRPYCRDATYLVDGMPVLGSPSFSATDAVNSLVSPADVAAIEVYKGDVGIPADLQIALSSQASGACGIVAIWTKR